MTKFVKVQFGDDENQVGSVPEGAVEYWVERGYKVIDSPEAGTAADSADDKDDKGKKADEKPAGGGKAK